MTPLELIGRLVLDDGQTYDQAGTDWQWDFFKAVFATNPDGTPTHRLCYDERRRGESKSADLAAAALADLYTGPPRHRSFVVAGDADQAALILDSIEDFRSRSPLLRDLQIQQERVLNPATASRLRIMSSDDRTAYGIRPRKVFFDELSLQTNDRLWLPMWTAIGKRPNAQMVTASMAGWDFASLAWRVRELAKSNPAYYFHTREGSELAPWLSLKDMAEQQVTLHPADFARFWECRWTEPMGSWISREMYNAAEQGKEALTATGFRTAGFVDIGLIRDKTAIAVVHQEGDRVVLDTLKTLQGTKNSPVELAAVEDITIELHKRYHVSSWIFEAPQAVASVQSLQKRGFPVTYRFPTAETQARLFGNLYRLFANGQVVLYPDEQLRRECLSLVTKVVGGRLKVVESSSVHQDTVIALGGAADILLQEADDEPNWPVVLANNADVSTGILQRSRTVMTNLTRERREVEPETACDCMVTERYVNGSDGTYNGYTYATRQRPRRVDEPHQAGCPAEAAINEYLKQKAEQPEDNDASMNWPVVLAGDPVRFEKADYGDYSDDDEGEEISEAEYRRLLRGNR